MAATAPLPHYRQIELVLRARLESMPPGERLPSDDELCREFGVSRMTARNAMQRLAEDGLVQRIPGRGTFSVAPPSHRHADRLMAFSHEMARLGRVPSSRLLDRDIRPSTAEQAALLGLRPTEPVVMVRRLRLADDQPIALETAVLVRRTATVVMAADLEGGSLHEALARAGLHLRRGQATITAEAAAGEDVRLLRVTRGSPLLVERRVIADGMGRPVEATESRYPGDRYALDVRFEVDDRTGDEAGLGPGTARARPRAAPARPATRGPRPGTRLRTRRPACAPATRTSAAGRPNRRADSRSGRLARRLSRRGATSRDILLAGRPRLSTTRSLTRLADGPGQDRVRWATPGGRWG